MKKIEELSLQEKIGQLLFIGVSSNKITKDFIDFIETYKIGNIVLYSNNFKSLEETINFTKSLYKVIMDITGIMPFIMIKGNIFSNDAKCKNQVYPSLVTLSSSNDLETSFEVGKIIGKYYSLLGVNVIDYVSLGLMEEAYDINKYSDKIDIVSRMSLETIKGVQENGIINCSKDFLSFTNLNYDKKELNSLYAKPLKESLNLSKALLISNDKLKCIDEENPMSLSKEVIQNFIRKEIKYKGLLIGNDMEEKALDDSYKTAVFPLTGIVAGLDMVCISNNKTNQLNALNMIKQAIEDKILLEEALNDKVNRILKHKKQVYKTLSKTFIKEKDSLEQIKDAKDTKLIQKVYDTSFTKIAGKDLKLSDNTLIINASNFKCENLGFASYNLDDNCVNYDLLEKIKEYNSIVILTNNLDEKKNSLKLINKLNNIHDNVYIISIGSPRDFLLLEGNVNFFTMYEENSYSLKTITKALNGSSKSKGVSPIDLVRHFKTGASIYIGTKEYTLNNNIKYLKDLNNNGVKDVFAFIKGSLSELKLQKELQKIIEFSEKEGINLTINTKSDDVEYFKSLSYKNTFSLRLDDIYEKDLIIGLLNETNLNISLNASIIKEGVLEAIKQSNLLDRIKVSYDCYPKPYTGLVQDKVLMNNMIFKKYGLDISIFIPSNSQKVGPVFQGITTIEDHRNANILANLSELSILEVDSVYFGDAYINTDEIKIIKEFDKYMLTIPVITFKGVSKIEKSIIERVHTNRIDETPYVYRSSIRTKNSIKPFNNTIRNVKDITVDNSSFDVYAGELSIIRQRLEEDGKVNVVGKAMISDWLLDKIKPSQKFKLVIMGEEKVRK